MPLHGKSSNDLVYVMLYIDNNLMVVDNVAIDDETKQHRKEGLVSKVIIVLWDYLSCKIRLLEEKK